MATCYEGITFDRCNSLLSVVSGMKVSRVRQSVDPCLFLELGRLKRIKVLDTHRSKGQVTLMIESDWRIEKPRSIQFGSAFSKGILRKSLPELVGTFVSSLLIDADSRELCAVLSDGRKLRTFSDWDTQPCWTILIRDRDLFPLDPVWSQVDVTPCLCMRLGRPCVTYCFDDRNADIAALKQLYRLPK